MKTNYFCRGFENDEISIACTLILSLFHQTLPNMKSANQKQNEQANQSTSQRKNDNDNVSSVISNVIEIAEVTEIAALDLKV